MFMRQRNTLLRLVGPPLAAALVVLLGGCAVVTRPLDAAQREGLAADAQRRMFEGQEPIERPLSLAEATARAIKYQAEHRQRRMEEAAAAAQLDVAQFDLLPKLTANAGYSTRSNDAFGFGFTPDGTIATTPTASMERTRSTASLGLAWNVLDFGVSYYRARQLSDQKLIAAERRRKAVQTLLHDVRVAWWRAEAAERLLPAADRLLAEVDQAIDKTRFIEARKLLPPVQTATLRRALLDLSQQIAFRRSDLAQAKIELAVLVNAPPGADLHVVTIDQNARQVPDLSADIEKLEVLALQMRPEMAEEGYRGRISADEARKALAGLLPGISFELGRNYDSNRFLINNSWTSAGVNVAFNLVKVFSLPALNRSEEAQRRADEARRLAMAMSVLAQTRLAAVRYALVADEFLIWDEAARDDDLIVQHLASSEKVGIDNELELIRARARAMASHINRDLAYANVQAGIARLFNSVGYDAVPREDEAKAVAELSELVELRFNEIERASFSPRAAALRPTAAVTEIAGATPRIAALLREGVERVLASTGMAAAGRPADVQLQMQLFVGNPEDGRRAARVAIVARPGPGGATLLREFRTSLSEPVGDEQWRVLGEGAVYRVLGEISAVRITRPALRAAQSLRGSLKEARRPPADNHAAASFDGGRLGLRLDLQLVAEPE
jgi:outer membrane protein TolC